MWRVSAVYQSEKNLRCSGGVIIETVINKFFVWHLADTLIQYVIFFIQLGT